MMFSRKEAFINDNRRRSYLSSVYTRMYRGKSVLIEGAYGVGKTRFLELIKSKKLKPVYLESLDNK
jgi:MoxR-like ATPase